MKGPRIFPPNLMIPQFIHLTTQPCNLVTQPHKPTVCSHNLTTQRLSTQPHNPTISPHNLKTLQFVHLLYNPTICPLNLTTLQFGHRILTTLQFVQQTSQLHNLSTQPKNLSTQPLNLLYFMFPIETWGRFWCSSDVQLRRALSF